MMYRIGIVYWLFMAKSGRRYHETCSNNSQKGIQVCPNMKPSNVRPLRAPNGNLMIRVLHNGQPQISRLTRPIWIDIDPDISGGNQRVSIRPQSLDLIIFLGSADPKICQTMGHLQAFRV